VIIVSLKVLYMFRASLLILIACATAMPLDDARLTYKADKSCAANGQMAALQNNLPNQEIKVTLKISITVSGQTSVSDGDVSVAGGAEQLLGCTLSGAEPPYISRKFEIVRVERK
jgi:hypothetical protein